MFEKILIIFILGNNLLAKQWKHYSSIFASHFVSELFFLKAPFSDNKIHCLASLPGQEPLGDGNIMSCQYRLIFI